MLKKKTLEPFDSKTTKKNRKKKGYSKKGSRGIKEKKRIG